MKLTKLTYIGLVLSVVTVACGEKEPQQPQDVNVGLQKQQDKPSKSLHLAAATGDIDQVQLLIARGADVNAKRVKKEIPDTFHERLNNGRQDCSSGRH
jgi:ankyrin repeat protein